jgi:copper chaperone
MSTREGKDSMTEVQFDVVGMSCAHCKAAVEGALNKLPGVESSTAGVDGGVARVSYDEGRVTIGQLEGAIEEAGYTVASSTGR